MRLVLDECERTMWKFANKGWAQNQKSFQWRAAAQYCSAIASSLSKALLLSTLSLLIIAQSVSDQRFVKWPSFSFHVHTICFDKTFWSLNIFDTYLIHICQKDPVLEINEDTSVSSNSLRPQCLKSRSKFLLHDQCNSEQLIECTWHTQQTNSSHKIWQYM